MGVGVGWLVGICVGWAVGVDVGTALGPGVGLLVAKGVGCVVIPHSKSLHILVCAAGQPGLGLCAKIRF